MVPIPVGYLEIWPILSLRCHIGHSLVRRRPKACLFCPKIPYSLGAIDRRLPELVVRWSALADIEADARIARVTERGVLLPIAASCAAFYGLIEPGWLAMVEGERVKAQRSKPANPFLRTLLMRLAVLSGGTAGVHDPRPAATKLR